MASAAIKRPPDESDLHHTHPHPLPPPPPPHYTSHHPLPRHRDLDNSPAHPAKLPRLDDDDLATANAAHAALSASKKRSSASSRTGQACDRCKIRKIRCDARPGGCSPCLQNKSECKTTDRITGRATSRGHTENIEHENQQLKMYMLELQQQLRDSGVEPKPPPSILPGYTSSSASTPVPSLPYHSSVSPSHSWDSTHQKPNGLASSTSQPSDRQATQGIPLPSFRSGCIGDNYLGVSSENNWLSTIEGTSLALFGAKIDLAEFMPAETDPASSPMSYQTFLNHAFGRTKPFAPSLPPYEQCKVYAEWYFRSVQTFMPILHKPDYMRLIDRIHNENYQPTSAELVMVHMVLAVMNFQFSTRNANQQAWNDSMTYYHYALSFIPDLITGHRFEDIQALILICSQLRNQPRPGAAWMFTNMVMGLAVESGLHRSAKAWQGSGMSQEPHHLEMRKRIFWSLLAYHVHISGKLGRPMPLRVEDFDIEIPEPLPDNLPDEPAPIGWKQCSWQAGYHGFQLLRIIMQVYSSIYSIKSTGQYETNMRTLEKELDTFHASLPPELRDVSQIKDEARIWALYLDLSVAECQLLLHHPSLCRSSNPELSRHNLDICLHWSNKMLDAASQLKDLKSLDTTWYYWIDFLAAIFTTLFASTERKDQMSSEDLQGLQRNMDRWLEVMGEASTLLGTRGQLQSSIQHIIEVSIDNISRHIAAKTASAAVASTASPTSQDQSSSQSAYQNQTASSHYYANATTNGHTYMDPSQNHQSTQSAYPSGDQFTYPPPHDGSMASYTNASAPTYNGSTYSNPESKSNNIEAQLVASMTGQAPPQSDFIATVQPNQQNHNTYQHNMDGSDVYPHSGHAAWRSFADSMVTYVGGQEYMSSPGAMMAMNGGKPGDGSMNMAAVGMAHLHTPSTDGSQHWPLIAYSDASHGGG